MSDLKVDCRVAIRSPRQAKAWSVPMWEKTGEWLFIEPNYDNNALIRLRFKCEDISVCSESLEQAILKFRSRRP